MDRNKLFKIILALIVIMAVVGLYFCFTPHIYDLNQNVKASLSGFKEYTDYHVMANFTDENGTVLAEDDHVFALSSTNDGKDFKLAQYESKNKKLDVDHCSLAVFDMHGNKLCSANYKFNTSDMDYVGTRETIIDIS